MMIGCTPAAAGDSYAAAVGSGIAVVAAGDAAAAADFEYHIGAELLMLVTQHEVP